MSQSSRVDAIPEAGRCWAIVKDMSKVSIATAANDFRRGSNQASVDSGCDHLDINWLKEAGPAGAGVELRIAFKQRLATANTLVHAIIVRIPVLASETRFGSFLPGDFELLGCQQFLPLTLGLHNLLANRLAFAEDSGLVGGASEMPRHKDDGRDDDHE